MFFDLCVRGGCSLYHVNERVESGRGGNFGGGVLPLIYSGESVVIGLVGGAGGGRDCMQWAREFPCSKVNGRRDYQVMWRQTCRRRSSGDQRRDGHEGQHFRLLHGRLSKPI